MISFTETRINGLEMQNLALGAMMAQAVLEASDYLSNTSMLERTPLETARFQVKEALRKNNSLIAKEARQIMGADAELTRLWEGYNALSSQRKASLETLRGIREGLKRVETALGNAPVRSKTAYTLKMKRRVYVEALKKEEEVLSCLSVSKRCVLQRVDEVKAARLKAIRILRSARLLKKEYRRALSDDVEIIGLAA